MVAPTTGTVGAAAYCQPMELALSTTPRETWVWTDSDQQKEQIQALLADAGCLVLPTSEPHPEPRAINVEIGVTAMESLQALERAGASFQWHPSQHEFDRAPQLFGMPVHDSRTGDAAEV